jgi:hypothetical protein
VRHICDRGCPISAGAEAVLSTDYSPTYYAAFVIDPDGNDLEAVRHGG